MAAAPEQLILQMGGDPGYVSPVARMTEQMGSKMLEGPVLLAGSVESMTLETAFLEAVILAEHKCHANWRLLARLAGELPDGQPRRAVQEAVSQMEPQVDEHIEWGTETLQHLAMSQVKPSLTDEVRGKPPVHTVPHKDGWANKREGESRVSQTFDTKAEAQAAGRTTAQREKTDHFIHNKDGKIGEQTATATPANS